MVPLFLCFYEDGSLRINRRSHGQNKLQRLQCRWSPVAAEPCAAEWTSERVVAKFLAVVSSDGCRHNTGQLAMSGLNAFTEQQLDYYTKPEDWYEIRIEKVRLLEKTERLPWKRGGKDARSGYIESVTVPKPLFYPFWGEGSCPKLRHRVGFPSTIQEQVEVWVGHKVALDDILALALPMPMMSLIQNGLLSNLLMRVAWHAAACLATGGHRDYRKFPKPLQDWPPHDSPVWDKRGTYEKDTRATAPDFNVGTLDTMLNTVRDARAHVAAIGACPIALDLQLTSVISGLCAWRDRMRSPFVDMEVSEHKRFRYSASKLVECIRLSALLRGGADRLVDVLLKSLSLIVPEFMRSGFIHELKKPGHAVPSASLIRRSELALDMSMVFFTQDRSREHSERVYRSNMIDSSPIRGTDWLWSAYKEAPQNKVIEIVDSFEYLYNAFNAFVEQQRLKARQEGIEDFSTYMKSNLPMEPKEEWKPHLQCIAKHVFDHTNVPAALASGHRTLADKASAEVYKWRLHTGTNKYTDLHADTYLHNAGDLGTEAGIPRFTVKDAPSSLLPPWFRLEQPLYADVDEVEQADHLEDFPAPCPGDDFEIPPPPAPILPRRNTGPLMKNCLDFAGLQHVLSNLNEDSHTKMKGFPQIFAA